jgi:hypothetical protein
VSDLHLPREHAENSGMGVPVHEARRLGGLRAAAVALLAMLSVVAGLSAPGNAVEATWSAKASHPYSDPVWFPLRAPSIVSCTQANCPGPFHGYWALDFIGELGDPVYAAGAGILHVGARDSSCKSSPTSKDSEGTWVWIDHGGGVVSRYHHLDAITVADGSLVTPATQIGRMGHSGDFAPCTTNYLHFEVRTGGEKGTRINPGQLSMCLNGTRTTLPGLWGYSSWNSVAKNSRTTPRSDNSCLPGGARTPSAVPMTAVDRQDGGATVRWSAPTDPGNGVTEYLVYQELWSPSVSRWGTAVRRLAAAEVDSLRITGLTNGRTYRFRVYARGADGYSAQGPTRTVIPAGAPQAPRVARWLTSDRTLVRYAWWKAQHRGTPVTGYRVGMRRWTKDGWSAYTFTTSGPSVLNRTWRGLRPGTTFQVRVQALSSAGAGPWSQVRRISTRGG